MGEEVWREVATSWEPVWQEIDSVPCGVRCLLLTRYGVAVIGALLPMMLQGGGYVAWCPLPKVPQRIKELLSGVAAD